MQDLEVNIRDVKPQNLVVCAAADEHNLEAVYKAYSKKIINPILIDDANEINLVANKMGMDISGMVIIDKKNISDLVQTSISMVKNREADILMKGRLSTSEILKGILHKEWGLKNRKLLSHFSIFEMPDYHKLLVLTDVAMNIAPDLQDKIAIINNTVEFFQTINPNKDPKVAVLAAVEMVNEKMQPTLDAALLTIMQKRGQIKNCIIDGPLAFDNAISFESKKTKGLDGVVAGDADILLAPDIESGNVLYKAFAFFTKAKMAGVLIGTSSPVVLTSRADSEETKYNSILLAAYSTMRNNV